MIDDIPVSPKEDLKATIEKMWHHDSCPLADLKAVVQRAKESIVILDPCPIGLSENDVKVIRKEKNIDPCFYCHCFGVKCRGYEI